MTKLTDWNIVCAEISRKGELCFGLFPTSKHDTSPARKIVMYRRSGCHKFLNKVFDFLVTLDVQTLNRYETHADPTTKVLINLAKQQQLSSTIIENSNTDSPGIVYANSSRCGKVGARLSVWTLSGKRFLMDYSKHISLRDVKYAQGFEEDTPPDEQRLFCNGIVLEDGHTLESYAITPLLVSTLKGDKPVIYIYPTQSQHCTVDLTLAPFWQFSHIYPTPSLGWTLNHLKWNVTAEHNGDLVMDGDEGSPRKKVPYLFWEAETFGSGLWLPFPLDTEHTMNMRRECFIEYLDTLLVDRLCMDYKQSADFITHWLPSFNKLDYVRFRFLTPREINEAAPLRVTPIPDIVHRVFLLFGAGETRGTGRFFETDWREVVMCGMNMEGWRKEKYSVLEWGGMFVEGEHSRVVNGI